MEEISPWYPWTVQKPRLQAVPFWIFKRSREIAEGENTAGQWLFENENLILWKYNVD